MLNIHTKVVLISILAWLCCCEKSKKVFRTCQVKEICANQTSEIASWECLGREVFKPTDDPASELYVEHDCGGVGWGNSIRGVVNAFAIAAVLNRRVIIKFSPGDKPFNKLWNPPNGLIAWDYGTTEIRARQNNIPAEYGDNWDWVGHPSKDQWSYEQYGRPPNRWSPWVKSLETSKERAFEYKKMILNSGICANDPDIFRGGNCLSKIFPLFDKCLNSGDRHSYLPDPLIFVPFFHTIFAKPSALMVRMLNKVRRRLSLPKLTPGFESNPGSLGLQTPGYYILALHFRRIPLGFEPLSVEVNNDRNLDWRLTILKEFWNAAVENAKQALQIANCRNQSLLIYFATDNVDHLREEAQQYLSPYGRVVFGLSKKEVGHVSPQWTATAITTMQDKALSLFKEGKVAVGSTSDARRKKRPLEIADGSNDGPQSSTELTVGTDGAVVESGGEVPRLEELMIDVDTNPEAVKNHAIMALVEWWILANSNWLQSHSGTSFSDTAAGWGLGPSSVMERLDIVQGPGNVQSVYRRDWNVNVCQPVAAANPEFAKTCPNHKFPMPQPM